MLLKLKMVMLKKGVRQARMAVDLGWDPAKLSRIINLTIKPTAEDRNAIATYLESSEAHLFGAPAVHPRPTSSGTGFSRKRRKTI